MMIVHSPNIVKIMNVRIHVLISYAAVELRVRRKLIKLFASALRVCRVIHWWLVLRLDVRLTRNVPQMKSVIILQSPHHERNAKRCVETIPVQRGLLAVQIIIEKSARAIILYKEMDTSLVQNVSIT